MPSARHRGRPASVDVSDIAPAWRRLLLVLCVSIATCCAVAPSHAMPPGVSVPGGTSTDADANEPPAPVDERFASPRATMASFLEAANDLITGEPARRDRARRIVVTALGLSDATAAQAPDHAARLLGILNRVGMVRLETLPDAGRAKDSTRFVYLPHERSMLVRDDQRAVIHEYPEGRIVLVRGDDGLWRFSEDTVASLEDFYTAVADMTPLYGEDEAQLSPALAIERRLRAVDPRLVTVTFLGVKLWKWLGLFAVAFLGFACDLIVRSVLRIVWRRIAARRKTELDPRTVSRSVKPFGLVAGAGVVMLLVHLLALPELAYLIVMTAARFAMAVGAVLAAYRLVDVVAELFADKAARTATRVDDLLIPLVRKSVKVVITAMGLVYIADALTIPVLPLLSGLGIGGLAVAFAAKDTIENFFGSIAVIVDRPFDVGDWVVVGDTEGTVEELGFRSTRIRTFYNSLVTVPNATLVRAVVDNYGRRKYRRYKTTLSLAYDTPPDRIEAFCAGVRELIRRHPYTRKDFYHVWLNEFGAHSLDVLVYMFHNTPDWSTELRERQRLMLDILRLARQLGVEFAFPTQTLYLRREDHQAPGYNPTPDRTAELKSQAVGARAARDLIAQQGWVEGRPPPPVAFDRSPADAAPPADDPEAPPPTQIESRTGGDA